MTKQSPLALVALVLASATTTFTAKDASSQQLEAVIQMADYLPFRIEANDSIKRLYIAGESLVGGSPLAMVDGNEHSLRFVDFGSEFFVPVGISLDRETGDVYAVRESGPLVTRVDALKDEILILGPPSESLRTRRGTPFPRLVDLNETTNTLYMLAETFPPKLLAFDLDAETLSEVVLPEFFALAIEANSVTNKIFVAASALDASQGILAVVDGADSSVTTISFGTSFFSQQAIVVNESTNTLYVGGDGVIDDVFTRALAVVDGNDYSFQLVDIDDFEVADLAVDPRANRVVAVGRESFGEVQLRTFEGSDGMKATPLGEFDVHSVAVDRYAGRIYVLGMSFHQGPQVLVFGPSGCSADPKMLNELVSSVQNLATSPETAASLLEQLERVQRALDRERPAVARERLARFQVDVVQFSNLGASDPNAVSLGDGNRIVCEATNVLGGIEVPAN